MPDIKAHWNCDHTYVIWRYEDAIDDCRGFALERKGTDDKVQAVNTWLGFEDEVADPGSTKPSTEWPIQRYLWADLEAETGDTWSYRVVPMVGSKGHLERADDQATDWTDPITVTASDKHGMSAYFNRGIVSSQWLSRKLAEDPSLTPNQNLTKIITTPGDQTRGFLYGELGEALLRLLHDVRDHGKTLYACLFELKDPELIEELKALGSRARVILANGTHKDHGDENEDARKQLKDAGVEVHDRMIRNGLSHNKFAVVCDANGEHPDQVWTGSTNWAPTGLCTQANNGLLIESDRLAEVFREQWNRIEAAGDEFTPELKDLNSQEQTVKVDGLEVTTWFAPVHDHVDLESARELIDGAQDGILFLMFFPGKADTLLQYVADRGTEGTKHYDPNLYVHGVINQDSGVSLVKRGTKEAANMEILLPDNVEADFGNWKQELSKLSPGGVNVHSKVIAIDPFGDNPVVMTGSHNLGHAASEHNDDNLVIIRGSSALAAAYAVAINGIYTHYRWRYMRSTSAKQDAGDRRFARSANGGGGKAWSGLQDNDTWQQGQLEGARLRELQFWLGERVAAPAPGG
jgi:phosphatidylserine/phosphatidylglycerophosphate/cardiolipin synthase-like enzyme